MGDPVKDEDLECLIMWPKGSKGWQNDYQLLRVLNTLCHQRGYGAVPQMASWIEEIWRDPEKKEYFAQMREQHLKILGEAENPQQEQQP